MNEYSRDSAYEHHKQSPSDVSMNDYSRDSAYEHPKCEPNYFVHRLSPVIAERQQGAPVDSLRSQLSLVVSLDN
jgi:hypothetical protein